MCKMPPFAYFIKHNEAPVSVYSDSLIIDDVTKLSEISVAWGRSVEHLATTLIRFQKLVKFCWKN